MASLKGQEFPGIELVGGMPVLELKTGRDIGHSLKVRTGKAPKLQHKLKRVQDKLLYSQRPQERLETSSAYSYSHMVPKCCPEATTTGVSTRPHLLVEKEALSGMGS